MAQYAVFYGPRAVSTTFDNYDDAYLFFITWVMHDAAARGKPPLKKHVYDRKTGFMKLRRLTRKTLRIKAIVPKGASW